MGRIKISSIPADSLKGRILKMMALVELSTLAKVNPGDLTNYFNNNNRLSKSAKHKIENTLIKLGFLPDKNRLRKLNKVTFAVHKVTKQVLTNPKIYAHATKERIKVWQENAVMFGEKIILNEN